MNLFKHKRILFGAIFGVIVCLEPAGACISFPKKISLSQSSFEMETFVLPETDRGIAFEHNDSSFFYNHSANQWCVFVDKNKRETEAPTCLKDNQSLYLTDDREGPQKGKELAQIQVNGKSLMLFSVNGKNKDTSKPYLKVSDSTTVSEREKYDQPGAKEKVYKSGLKVEALSFTKGTLGSYDIEAKMAGPLDEKGKIKVPKMRGIGPVGKEEDSVDINGKEVVSEAGCGGKTKINPRNGGSGPTSAIPAKSEAN